jgi:hypothetical protein
MTPKEKAKEMMHYYLKELLSAKYSINGFVIKDLAKKCCLISVDEILKVCENEISHCSDKTYFYWQEVKNEIEKL